MKKCLLLFFLLCLSMGYAQDKISYLDSLKKPATAENYKFTRVIKDYDTNKDVYTVQLLDESGQIQSQWHTNSKDEHYNKIGPAQEFHKNGKISSETMYEETNKARRYKEWYENGKPKLEGQYIDSPDKSTFNLLRIDSYWNPEGKQTVTNGNGYSVSKNQNWTEEGKIKNGLKDSIWSSHSSKNKSGYLETYKDGKFITGEGYNDDGSKFYYDAMEVKPEPKAGIQHFYKYIGEKMILKDGVYGKILVKFVVEKDGTITDINIIKGIDPETDQHAIKIIKAYPKWKPGQQRGRNVRVLFTIPITIKEP